MTSARTASSHQNSHTHTTGSSRNNYQSQASPESGSYGTMDPITYARVLYEYTRQQLDQAAAQQTTPISHGSSNHRSTTRPANDRAMA